MRCLAGEAHTDLMTLKERIKKNRLYFDAAGTLLFLLLMVFWLLKYLNEGKNAGLWLAIFFGLTAGLKLSDTISTWKSWNNNKS